MSENHTQAASRFPRPARIARTFGVAAVFALVCTVSAEWPNYRGPNHDGVYSGVLRTNWNVEPPKVLWRQSIDPALSSMTVANGRVFTQARRRAGSEDREYAVALDAQTGASLWSTDLDLADYPNGGVGGDDGPRSTPVIDGDRVYVFSSYLRLHCLDAATGRAVWSRNFPAELGSNVINWQNAASPVIEGDLILVNGNGSPDRLMGIRKSDGTTAWRRHDARMTQATPVLTTLAGIRQAIFFAQPGLYSVRPDTGELLWQFPFPYSTSTAASPVVGDDIVFCSAAYNSGSGAVRISATATGVASRELWKRRSANMNHWATPVYHEGHVYGIFGQSQLSLRCVNIATGTETWRSETVGTHEIGYGSILLARGLLFVLNESGEIVLAAPDPANYRPLQRFQAVSGKCWNNPAISAGIAYVRSTTEIAAIDLRPSTPPQPLRLVPGFTLEETRARISLRTSDGSPISRDRANEITLLQAPDPTLASDLWKTVPATRTLTDGILTLEVPRERALDRVFFRTRE